MNLALFGAGRMGCVHGVNAARDAKVRYVVDPDVTAARELAKRIGAEVTGPETALADPAVDAVLITSPTPTHFDLITRAARTGKAVFTEKPVDLSYARVVACLEVVAEHGVPFMVGFQRRFDPTFRALKESLQDVEMVRITSRDPAPPPAAYVATSGGIFRDMMIHDFDMARWLLGEEPTEVFATGSDALDRAVCVLKTASGKLCHIENSRHSSEGYDQRVEVLGSRGVLRAENVGAMPYPFFPVRYADAYAAELRHFISAVERRDAPETGPEAGLLSLALADAATKSAETKTVVRP